ncbi:hypothetical protein [Legionella rowbothamii]|uniref:hypothetical protein n=1 Tax=Legionella rowbothamii TaxID=96229 RepID=UPI0010543425|nr:hypothetical protein [Legionella rowbothamii]
MSFCASTWFIFLFLLILVRHVIIKLSGHCEGSEAIQGAVASTTGLLIAKYLAMTRLMNMENTKEYF